MNCGLCFPILEFESQLKRIYNLKMHLSGDIDAYPWSWVMYWSRLLEDDLMKRRMADKTNNSRQLKNRMSASPRRR